MPAAATRADAVRLEQDTVEVRQLRAVGTIPGASLLAAGARNAPGTGHLRSTGSGTDLSWKAPGGSYGGEVDVSAGGDFLLEDGIDPDKWARVNIVVSRLTPSPAEARVLLGDVWENRIVLDDVTAAEASAGDVTTWTVNLKNECAFDVLDLRVWLDPAVSGIEIGKNGADWYAPDSEGHADVLIWDRVAGGGSETLHLRRTIGAGADPATGILNLLKLRWLGL